MNSPKGTPINPINFEVKRIAGAPFSPGYDNQLKHIKVLMDILYMTCANPENERVLTPLLNSAIQHLNDTRTLIQDKVDQWLLRNEPRPAFNEVTEDARRNNRDTAAQDGGDLSDEDTPN